MTSHMHHHLPTPDDAAFERFMDALDADGLEVRPEERAALAAAHEFGWLAGILPVIHRAMDMGSLSPSAAADARRMVRHLREDVRPDAHRAVFMAAENHPPTPRYQVSKDGKTFFHFACDRDLPGGIDREDTHDKATAHHHTCSEVRDV